MNKLTKIAFYTFLTGMVVGCFVNIGILNFVLLLTAIASHMYDFITNK